MGDILFLAHRIPFPPDRGDKIRSYHIVRYLAARRRVHLAAFVDDARDAEYEAALADITGDRIIVRRDKGKLRAAAEALVRGHPVSLTAFDHAAMHVGVTDLLARHDVDTIFVFSSQMAQYLPRACRARVIMDFVDMDSAKFAGYAANAHGPKRWMMRREARLLLAHDSAVADRADASLFVSAAEARLFVAATGAERVRVVENGVDTATFNPAAAYAPVPGEGPLIVFTGQMDYPPNIDAVTSFADHVLPLVRHGHPDCRFAIVGRAPSAAILALARRPGVIVTGEVTDIRCWLASADVVVAPLTIARGIQNKVLEAMAMARPVIASTAAAEGIDHAGTIRIADDPGAIASAVDALLADPVAAAALGASARAQVIARYSWAARLAPLGASLAEPPLSRPPPVAA